MKWCFKAFQACSKKGKDNQKFQKYFSEIFFEKKFSENLGLQKFLTMQGIMLTATHVSTSKGHSL